MFYATPVVRSATRETPLGSRPREVSLLRSGFGG